MACPGGGEDICEVVRGLCFGWRLSRFEASSHWDMPIHAPLACNYLVPNMKGSATNDAIFGVDDPNLREQFSFTWRGNIACNTRVRFITF
jgi:hypothetical protein